MRLREIFERGLKKKGGTTPYRGEKKAGTTSFKD